MDEEHYAFGALAITAAAKRLKDVGGAHRELDALAHDHLLGEILGPWTDSPPHADADSIDRYLHVVTSAHDQLESKGAAGPESGALKGMAERIRTYVAATAAAPAEESKREPLPRGPEDGGTTLGEVLGRWD